MKPGIHHGLTRISTDGEEEDGGGSTTKLARHSRECAKHVRGDGGGTDTGFRHGPSRMGIRTMDTDGKEEEAGDLTTKTGIHHGSTRMTTDEGEDADLGSAPDDAAAETRRKSDRMHGKETESRNEDAGKEEDRARPASLFPPEEAPAANDDPRPRPEHGAEADAAVPLMGTVGQRLADAGAPNMGATMRRAARADDDDVAVPLMDTGGEAGCRGEEGTACGAPTKSADASAGEAAEAEGRMPWDWPAEEEEPEPDWSEQSAVLTGVRRKAA